MKKPIKVKDIIDLIQGDRIEVVEMHHFVGKGSETQLLWHFDAYEPEEYQTAGPCPEIRNREVMRVYSRGKGEIRIEVFK